MDSWREVSIIQHSKYDISNLFVRLGHMVKVSIKKIKKLLDKTLIAVYNIKYKLNIKTGVEMASAKNYTDEMVATMTEQYVANPTRDTVDALAREFGKTTRSIIAKLSREGVYVAQPRTTKTGEPVVSKAQFVSAIESHFDIAMPTLVKSGKQDLQKLAEALGLEVIAS